MKVIGKSEERVYLCQVEHGELERFLGKFYPSELHTLTVGQIVDLSKGYNYSHDINRAMEKTRDFIQAHQKVVNAIIDGLRFENIDAEVEEETQAEPA
jgi:hypothetical protein